MMKDIMFKIFRELPRKQQTRRNWSIVKKRGLLGIPKLPLHMQTILRLYRDVQAIDKFRNPQLRNTGNDWFIDMQLEDIEMEISAGGTHMLRGIVLSINSRAEVFLRRTVYTRNEVGSRYLHSHTHSFDIRTYGNRDYGSNLLSSTRACLGDYHDVINRLCGRLRSKDSYSKVVLLTYLNYFYQILTKENSDSPLRRASDLREKYVDISNPQLTTEDVAYLVDNNIVTFNRIRNAQNNITFQMTVHDELIPDEFKERYLAYYHNERFYQHLTVPDAQLDESDYENLSIPYGDTSIPITIIANDNQQDIHKVFNTSVFTTNHTKLIKYAIQQASRAVDRSNYAVEAHHQS